MQPTSPEQVEVHGMSHNALVEEVLSLRRLRRSGESLLDSLLEERSINSTDPLDKVRRIRRDRQAAYGHPREEFTRVAGMWGAMLGVIVTPDDVARMMILLKVARDKHGYKPDNMLDVIGYALTREDLVEPPISSDHANPNPDDAGLRTIEDGAYTP